MAPKRFSGHEAFRSRKELLSHTASTHKLSKKACPICNKVFLQKKLSGNFERHLETHLPTGERKRYKCSVEQCSKEYFWKKHLKRHVAQVHPLSPRKRIKCDHCSKEYYSTTGLIQHVQQIHSGCFTKFECNFCDATFTGKSGRDEHIVSAHTREKAFKCEECPSKFVRASSLRSHQFVHTDERPIKCKTCFKQFKRLVDLRAHVKNVHTPKTKDFRCSMCQKTFFTKRARDHHARSHNPEGEQFSCYFCSKGFFRRTEHEQHLRTHTQEQPIFCPAKSCQYSTAYRGCLKRHTWLHHSPNSRIVPAKTWSCYFCRKTLSRFSHLVNHSRDHTLEKPFRCALCSKSYKCSTTFHFHISSHTGEKPHGCPECEKCFVRKWEMKSHLAKHTQTPSN